jgi:hypothetical protein
MHSRYIKKKTTSAEVDSFLTQPFSKEEMLSAVLKLKAGKAQGPDKILAEFLMNCECMAIEWFCGFYSNCMSNLPMRKIWLKATVIAIPLPNKPKYYP